MTFCENDRHNRAASALALHPDFRVLRRLQPVGWFHRAHPGARTRVGVVIDVETIGLHRETDRIIELAVQRFRFDDAGRIVQVGTPRTWREDPGVPIDARITKLTGIAAKNVAGQTINEAAAVEILSSADLIVAHNAAFGRPFVDRRLPAVADKPWQPKPRAISRSRPEDPSLLEAF